MHLRQTISNVAVDDDRKIALLINKIIREKNCIAVDWLQFHFTCHNRIRAFFSCLFRCINIVSIHSIDGNGFFFLLNMFEQEVVNIT